MQTEINDRRYYSREFENLNRRIFANYDNKFDKGFPVLPIGYLVITGDSYENAANTLGSWKMQKGYNVTVTTTSDIGGSDTASIAAYIRNAYNTWTIPPTFVTLIGDVDVINTYPGIWASQYSDYAQATDLHYVRTDGTDIYPDMGIARISVASLSEANEYVSKVINYEKFQFTSTDWLGRALFIASNDHASMLEGTHRYCMTTWLDPAGITSDSVWSSTGGSTADISSSINNGVVWVNYSGHGNVTYWDDPSFTASNISALTNQNKYPFVVSNACYTGSFNSSTCFAESWIRNTGKGAIGHLGASNYSYWDEDDVFEPNLYEAFFDSMNFSTSMQLNIAKMLLADSLGETPNVKYYFEEYNIIGEPSVDLWMGIPSTMVISHNGTLPIGSSSYTVNVNIDNALVSLYYNDTLYGSSYSSGDQAVVTLSPSPDHTFDMLLTVTRHGYEPYFDTISVISPSGPFVVYLSSTIDDASGNNNGQINPGETIDLSVYLKNVGVAGATNVNAVLSTTDPDVIVNTDSSNYGNIAAGDSALSITDYDFTVGTVNNGHSIPFDIAITATESTWTGSFSLMVYAPVISQETFAIDDATTGNGNGKWDAAEQVKLLFGVKNSGGELAKNVNINITTTTSGITINDGSAIFGDIDTSATVTNTTDDLLATSSASVPTGTAVTIDYTISGDNFTDVTGSVNAIVGQMHYIIFDVDENHNSGSVMHTVLTNLGYQGDYYTTFSPMVDSLTNYASAFVFAGIYNNNQKIYPDTGAKFANYCQNDGGKFYLEGGDVWYWDPSYGGYDFESLCGINGTSDGTGDLATIGGVATTFTEGMSFSYTGDNSFIDHLSPIGAGYTIFNNSSPAYVCGIANDVRAYRTVGFSFEFGGLTDGSGVSSKDTLALNIMEFFGIQLQGVAIDRFSALKSNRKLSFGIKAKGSNLFSNKLDIEYGIVHSGKVEIEIYNTTGRKIKTLMSATKNAGYHRISWNGKDSSGKNLVNGIYFVTIKSSGKVKNTKVMLIK